jgi:hypothetical protein
LPRRAWTGRHGSSPALGLAGHGPGDSDRKCACGTTGADRDQRPREVRPKFWQRTEIIVRGDQWTGLKGLRDFAKPRAKLKVDGSRLQSLINGKDYGIGELELVSLQALRERMKSAGGLPAWAAQGKCGDRRRAANASVKRERRRTVPSGVTVQSAGDDRARSRRRTASPATNTTARKAGRAQSPPARPRHRPHKAETRVR